MITGMSFNLSIGKGDESFHTDHKIGDLNLVAFFPSLKPSFPCRSKPKKKMEGWIEKEDFLSFLATRRSVRKVAILCISKDETRNRVSSMFCRGEAITI